jgi:Holliday junction DNA helicase RuvB
MSDEPRRAVQPERNPDDDDDMSLRPTSFAGFVGQGEVVRNLKTWIKAAKASKRVLDHSLLMGPPGLGKTTLATLIARELAVPLVMTSGPVLERIHDLAGMLTRLGEGTVLFIDEIHRLRTHVEEYLYSAMEDFRIDVAIDEGPHARSVSVALSKFTLIGATTRAGLLSKPFRDRFGIQERLRTYRQDELSKIVTRSARVLDTRIAAPATELIASRSRGTPRVANRFLARLRDVALAEDSQSVTLEVARRGLDMLGVDAQGLDEMDRRILAILAESPGTAVGLKTLAVATSEEPSTIEDVYEPYLIQSGYLRKTARGRVLGPRGYDLLGLRTPDPQTPQGTLFA